MTFEHLTSSWLLASMHALGSVEWVSTSGPWMTGVVDTPAVFVHYVAGTRGFHFDEVVAHVFELRLCRWTALALTLLVRSARNSCLLVAAVERGVIAGEVLPR